MLMIPDLFNYLMTGEICSEYTIASTSQLLNARTGEWSEKILYALGIPGEILPPIVPPGTILGALLPELREATGLREVPVIAPPCHDTASAVVAVPATGSNWAYLSSGTWSLVGIETEHPIITEQSRHNNFTNEGGFNETIRFLRNNMGLWLIERCRSEWKDQGREVGYRELLDKVSRATPFRTLIEPDDHTFLNPQSMQDSIQAFAQGTGQPIPESAGEFGRCIFESLALKYRMILEQIDLMRDQKIEQLHVVGGGSQNSLLNQFTANATGKPVLSGPIEATAIGNILVQAIAAGVLSHLDEGRKLVHNSFQIGHFEPEDPQKWEKPYERFKKLTVEG
jgi:rhamnulokinase